VSAPVAALRRARSRGASRIAVVAMVLAGLLAVAAVVGFATGVFVRPGASGGAATSGAVAPVHGGVAAQDAAHRACAAMAAFVGQLRSNAAADAAKSTLGQAEALAKAASDADHHWIALLGAVEAVRVSIDHNTAGDAVVGIGVVRDECEGLGVTVP
jgi:hypothetical protein